MFDDLFLRREMFRHACTFCECADLAAKEEFHKTADIGMYYTAANVNSALACEIFCKALLKHFEIEHGRIHKLNELFVLFPEDLQTQIKQRLFFEYGYAWNNKWGMPYMDNISNAFAQWRYIYEHDWEKSSVIVMETGFLNAFRNVLRDVCCLQLFCKNWNDYKES